MGDETRDWITDDIAIDISNLSWYIIEHDLNKEEFFKWLRTLRNDDRRKTAIVLWHIKELFPLDDIIRRLHDTFQEYLLVKMGLLEVGEWIAEPTVKAEKLLENIQNIKVRKRTRPYSKEDE